MKKVLCIGATSTMAQETVKIFAAEKASLFLVGRNSSQLQAIAQDLTVRGATHVTTRALDLCQYADHAKLIKDAFHELKTIDYVLIAHGYLGTQSTAESEFTETAKIIDVNMVSPISLLNVLAPYLEKQGHGAVAVISSVAGDRGRRSNYIYASAKAGLSTFLSGYRARLSASGVSVIDIRPGFVDTPMTSSFQKGPLWASAKSIGRGIYNTLLKPKPVVYMPMFWRLIMLIIKSIPTRIFNRLKF